MPMTAGAKYLFVEVFGLGGVDAAWVRQYCAVVGLRKMNADSSFQGSEFLDSCRIDADLIQFLKGELAKHVLSNTAKDSCSSPQLGELSGENISRATQFQGIVVYNLLDLVKCRTDVSANYQVHAHVRYGANVPAIRR